MIMTLLKAFLAVALVAAPLATAGCETTAQSVQKQETSLTALGFVARPADTPVRAAMLAKLPPQKFLRRTHGTTIHYIYADPLDCHCLYVGSAKAFAQYRQLQQLRMAVKETRNTEFAEAMAGSDYSNGEWDWGVWGGFGPDFDAGPGSGW
jgi:hypothetical protein